MEKIFSFLQKIQAFTCKFSARSITSSVINPATEYKPQLGSDTNANNKTDFRHCQKTSFFGVDGQPSLFQPLRQHLARLRAGLAPFAR